MRPIKLELCGLNSYIEKTTIDFEKLTERGLFGIFGNTGSGKSTILDAITIAMYDNIPRNTNEFINSTCDKAIISYEFEIGSKNAKRRYKIDRTIVKNDTGHKTSYAKLVEQYGNETEKVLADKVEEVNSKITEIVGLTAEDFTKSVVLPQGKFNEFLKLTGSDRRDMLERIFNLEKYGSHLIDKVRTRKNFQVQKLRDINSKLSQYEDVSEELYKQIEKELETLKTDADKNDKDFEIAQNKYVESKAIYEKQVQKESCEKRKKELDLKQLEMKDKVIQLENGRNAEKVNPYIIAVQDLEKKLNIDTSNIEILEKKLDILSKELLISKNKYEEAYSLKNINIPKLMEEKNKIQRAIKLEEELIGIDKELKEIKEKGLGLEKEKEKSDKSQNNLEIERTMINKSVKDLEIEINKLKISSELKQKIFLAYEYEKEYNKYVEEKNIKVNRLREITKKLDEMNLKIKYIQRDKGIIDNKLNNEEIHYEGILKKNPGSHEDIVNKTEYVTNLKLKVDIVKEKEVKKDKLQAELNQILENKHHIERELNTTIDILEGKRKSISDLEKDIDKLRFLNLASELRNELKENMPCPVCGSRVHHDLDKSNQDEQISFSKSKLDKLKLEEIAIKNSVDELNGKNSENISTEKIKIKEMEEIKAKIGENKSIDLKNKLDEESKKLEVLKTSVKRWEQDKESTQIKIRKLTEERHTIEKEEIKLEESINTYKNTTKEINQDIDEVDNKIKKVKEDYIGLKAIVKIQDLSSKVIEINKNEKLIEELDLDYIKLYKNKEKIEDEIKNAQQKLHLIELELMKSNEIYIEKRKFREEKYNDALAITKGELSKNILNNLEENINKLITSEESTKKKLEFQRIEYEKYSSEKSNVDGSLTIAKNQYETQSEVLKQLLIDYKFESIYAVKRCILGIEHKKRLEDEINEYDEELKILTLKINELIELLGGRTIKNEVFEELKNKIYNAQVEKGRIAKEIGAKENKLTILRESLTKVKELNKDKNLVQNKVDLLGELSNVIQENRFVEYVATNQLKYIGLEASRRLEGITKGRYALEIDSTLNFVMRDNFNGGQRRSVDTLSGGETFLTSLSLALALSSQIKLKGGAPLEFLFLDEGFGSLDNELLEIVMQSLERLQSDKLSVGIISHVEELKNRVPIKLLVQPSEAGVGSKVNIEYS